MNNERDIHFANFARLLWEEMAQWQEPMQSTTHLRCDLKREQSDAIERLIARRAYDLVLHTANCMDSAWLDRLDMEEIPARIPDMTAFPEVQS